MQMFWRLKTQGSPPRIHTYRKDTCPGWGLNLWSWVLCFYFALFFIVFCAKNEWSKVAQGTDCMLVFLRFRTSDTLESRWQVWQGVETLLRDGDLTSILTFGEDVDVLSSYSIYIGNDEAPDGSFWESDCWGFAAGRVVTIKPFKSE